MRRIFPLSMLSVAASVLVVAGATALPVPQVDPYSQQATQEEMREFRQFLDSHTWIANKLRQNPSLANNQDFLNGNPPLPQFLNAHPFVQAGLKNDASGFMRQAQDFTASPPPQYGGDWRSSQDPATASEMRDFQQFLDDHSRLAKQLQDDPSLANNRDFLNNNPDFAQFLSAHPYVQRGLQANATGFMRRTQRYAGGVPDSSGGNWNSWGNQANNQEMSDFQKFLTDHPWIAKKLRENPSLANNSDFLHDNPPLPQFLNAHPYVQSQMRADPGAFLQRERDYTSGGGQPGGWDPHGADIAALHQFMLNHPWIGKQLRERPKAASSDDFLNENKELKDFLTAHEYLQQQFKQDARGLMDRERALGGQF